MEILDKQFLELRERKRGLIQKYCEDYRQGNGFDEELDVARLIGFLTFKFPTAAQFPPGIEKTCLVSLENAGISSGSDLLKAMRGKHFSREIKRYSGHHSLEPSKVSHLALVIITVLLTDAKIAKDLFPGMFSDWGLNAALEAADQRRAKRA
ncbi:MAG: hypothetical protein A3C54_05765 [Deltaproteobacteria bacterium RIFCSPHIGHO2_02_FULL_60_17]|nr:MAG: hypothetical protein A3C54_05765 [Deltaproteobacteria bacterium RIFCSPHIGHO2_02_FULL_60_17]